MSICIGLLVVIQPQVKPINNAVVVGGSIVSAAACGALGYAIMHYVEKNYPNYTTKRKKQLVKTIVTLIAAGSGGGLVCWLLSKYTPQGRMKRAEALLREIDSKRLTYDDGPLGFNLLQARFSSSDIPLVNAMDEVNANLKKIDKAHVLINSACQEDAYQDVRGQGLRNRLNTCSQRGKEIELFIINNHGPAYRLQRKTYEDRKIKEREIELKKEEANRKRNRDFYKRLNETEKISLANKVSSRNGTKININL